MPKYGLSLVRVFPYTDRIISAFSCISYSDIVVESFQVWENTGKYRSEKAHILAVFKQWNPYEGVLIFSKLGD